jgi:hypothetical protein
MGKENSNSSRKISSAILSKNIFKNLLWFQNYHIVCTHVEYIDVHFTLI